MISLLNFWVVLNNLDIGGDCFDFAHTQYDIRNVYNPALDVYYYTVEAASLKKMYVLIIFALQMFLTKKSVKNA